VDDLLNRTTRASRPHRRRFPLWLAAALVMLIIALGVVLYRQFMPLGAPIPPDAGALYIGLEQGYTEQGFPRLGSPDAPVVVEEFASYACSHCRDFHDERFPDLLDEIAAGQVQFVLIPVPQIGPGAGTAAKAAFCAGEQGRYWEMSDVLFDWQQRFITLTFADRRIRQGAENMGLDPAAFDACMSENHPGAVIDAARSEFRRRGLSGTPSFFANGEKVRDYEELDNLGDWPIN
jgi:protein-disulfide isomerase